MAGFVEFPVLMLQAVADDMVEGKNDLENH